MKPPMARLTLARKIAAVTGKVPFAGPETRPLQLPRVQAASGRNCLSDAPMVVTSQKRIQVSGSTRRSVFPETADSCQLPIK